MTCQTSAFYFWAAPQAPASWGPAAAAPVPGPLRRLPLALPCSGPGSRKRPRPEWEAGRPRKGKWEGQEKQGRAFQPTSLIYSSNPTEEPNDIEFKLAQVPGQSQPARLRHNFCMFSTGHCRFFLEIPASSLIGAVRIRGNISRLVPLLDNTKMPQHDWLFQGLASLAMDFLLGVALLALALFTHHHVVLVGRIVHILSGKAEASNCVGYAVYGGGIRGV